MSTDWQNWKDDAIPDVGAPRTTRIDGGVKGMDGNAATRQSFLEQHMYTIGIVLGIVLIGAVAAIITVIVLDGKHKKAAPPAPCALLPDLPSPWAPATLAWQPCTTLNSGAPGPPGVNAECAFATVPMAWTPANLTQDTTTLPDPLCLSKATLTLTIKRIFLGSTPSVAVTQFWWLAGELGQAAIDDYDAQAASLVASQSKLVMYLTNLRGTGNSSYLGCEPAALFWTDRNACFGQVASSEAGQELLATLSFTSIAHDLIWLARSVDLDSVAASQRRLLVADGMHGFIAQRLLSVLGPLGAAGTIDAAVLVSSPPAVGFAASLGFLASDGPALEVLAECQATPVCAEHFSNLTDFVTSPMSARTNFIQLGSLGTHPCLKAIGSNFGTFSSAMATQLETPGSYEFIAVLMLRLERCNAADQSALRHFLAQIPSNVTLSQYDSPFTGWALTWMELYGAPHQAGCSSVNGGAAYTFAAAADASSLCSGWQAVQGGDAGAGFLQVPDAYVGSVPDITPLIAVVALAGQADGTVPRAQTQLLNQLYGSSSNFHLVQLPRVGHTAWTSPVNNSAISCGQQMVLSVATSALFSVDTSCLDYLLPYDWSGASLQDQAARYLGVAAGQSMWNS